MKPTAAASASTAKISGNVTQESLRTQIGLVTQDTSLLHRSVRDNILYGRPDAGDEDMYRAAEQAEAAESLPNLSDAKGRRGYDAHVGERGVKLSGGQRQRIAIARVMLKTRRFCCSMKPPARSIPKWKPLFRKALMR